MKKLIYGFLTLATALTASNSALGENKSFLKSIEPGYINVFVVEVKKSKEKCADIISPRFGVPTGICADLTEMKVVLGNGKEMKAEINCAGAATGERGGLLRINNEGKTYYRFDSYSKCKQISQIIRNNVSESRPARFLLYDNKYRIYDFNEFGNY